MGTSAGTPLGPVDATIYDDPRLQLDTNEVRVLIFEHESENSKPRLRLEKRRLNLQPDTPIEQRRAQGLPTRPSPLGTYAALSYVWGSPENPRAVTINGSDFFVSQNLFDALAAINKNLGPAELWVDAICINQTDDKEKKRQIILMGDIYSHAKKTIIWLGNPGLLGRLSFLALEKLAGELKADLGERWENHRTEQQTNPFIALAGLLGRILSFCLLSDANGTIWKHSIILPILTREYFTRIWTVQEFALRTGAVDIFCGNHRLDMTDFILGSTESIMMESSKPGASAIYNMFVCRGLLARSYDRFGTPDAAWDFWMLVQRRTGVDTEPDLLTLLNLFRTSAATDPIDKVFGLTGLSKAVNPDGTYDMDGLYPERSPGQAMNDPKRIRSTFVSVARRIVERQQSLRLLGSVRRCEDRSASSCSLPGWVPNSPARRLLRGFLEALGLIQSHQSRSLSESDWGLPSWVPDWSDTRRVPPPFYGAGGISEQLNASSRIVNRGDRLVLHGILLRRSSSRGPIDRIVKLGQVCDSMATRQGLSFRRITRALRSLMFFAQVYRLDIINSWANDFLPDPTNPSWNFLLTATGGSAAQTGETTRPVREMLTEHQNRGPISFPSQMIWRTISLVAYIIYELWGLSADEIREALMPSVYILFVLFPLLLYIKGRMWPSLGEPVELEGAELRRMVQMASGKLVLAPAAAKVGDVVACCQGGAVPLVLRPVGGGFDVERVEEFELVGEGYICELMDSSRWAVEGRRRICLV